ncbi:MAG: 50S ribosomal protein L29 [bacterium]|nr:50S ribosomal protein L29 [bacterium]
MNALELRELDAAELVEKLDEAKEELFNLRFQMATNQLDNTARLRQVRREVARINTVIREQEIAAWQRLQEEA